MQEVTGGVRDLARVAGAELRTGLANVVKRGVAALFGTNDPELASHLHAVSDLVFSNRSRAVTGALEMALAYFQSTDESVRHNIDHARDAFVLILSNFQSTIRRGAGPISTVVMRSWCDYTQALRESDAVQRAQEDLSNAFYGAVFGPDLPTAQATLEDAINQSVIRSPFLDYFRERFPAIATDHRALDRFLSDELLILEQSFCGISITNDIERQYLIRLIKIYLGKYPEFFLSRILEYYNPEATVEVEKAEEVELLFAVKDLVVGIAYQMAASRLSCGPGRHHPHRD